MSIEKNKNISKKKKKKMSSSTLKEYTLWKGSNYFFNKGKCITGPKTIFPLLITTLIIVFPNLLFIISNKKVK